MNKEDLLKHIAETAYNVGFGAKKHFATYDIVAKAPGAISFLSLAFGIYALIFESLSAKHFSATLIILGIMGLYIFLYDSKKNEYSLNGQKLTDLFNELKRLYGKTKSSDGPFDEQIKKLEEIEQEYTSISSSHQILFSNWYAHYKFFWEQQIGWIDEQLNFRFLRDKIPLSLSISVIAFIAMFIIFRFELVNLFCCTVNK